MRVSAFVRPEHVIAAAYVAAHLPSLSPTLEDIDSLNFALGLRDFDPGRHQPHPPGYPVYVALGRMSYAVVARAGGSLDRLAAEALALSIWSVIAGAMAIVAAFLFFIAMAIIVSNVAARVRTQALVAMTRARTTESLYAFSLKLAGAGTLDDVLWATAYQIASMLEGVVDRGTATAARVLDRRVGGKTGTTNEYRSAWFVGFSPQIVVGTYIGFDDNRELGDQETGGRAALPIFREIMLRVYQHQLAGLVPEFPGEIERLMKDRPRTEPAPAQPPKV